MAVDGAIKRDWRIAQAVGVIQTANMDSHAMLPCKGPSERIR